MLRYLHVQAEPVMRNFAKRMIDGNFVLHPNSDIPIAECDPNPTRKLPSRDSFGLEHGLI